MPGERQDSRLFLSSRILNFFSPSKSDPSRMVMELSFSFNTSSVAGRAVGTFINLFFQSSKVFSVFRILNVPFSTDSVPLASKIKSSRANTPVKFDSYKSVREE